MSQPIEDFDEEDLFNFEDDGEVKKKQPTPKRKRQPSNNGQNSKKLKIQGDSNRAPLKDPPQNPTQPQSLVNSPKNVTRGSYMSKSKTKPYFEVTKSNKTLTLSMPKKTSNGDHVPIDPADAVKEHIDEKELTRSFVTLEVRSLVSDTSQTIIQSASSTSRSNQNVVNVKAFKKQGVAKAPTTVIDCNVSFIPSLVIGGNRQNENRSGRNTTRVASPEVPITTPAAPKTSRRDANDEVENLWKFDESQQSARKKRKR